MTTNLEYDTHSEGSHTSFSLLKRLQILDPALYIRQGVNPQRSASMRDQQQHFPSMLDSSTPQQHNEDRQKGGHLKAEPASGGEGAQQPMTGESATSTTTLDNDAGNQSSSCSSSISNSGSGSGDEVFVVFVTGNGDDSSSSSPLLPTTAKSAPKCNTGEDFTTRKRTTKTASCEDDNSAASSKSSSDGGGEDEEFVAEITGTN